MKSTHHYSGDKSKAFWKRVNRLPRADKSALYLAGVLLQNMEEVVLKALDYAERDALNTPTAGKDGA